MTEERIKPEIVAYGSNDRWSDSEKEAAYQSWSVESAFSLKRTAESTGVPYQTIWRWHRDYDWTGRWGREWSRIVEPSKIAASAIVAARVSEIVTALTITAVNPGPQQVAAARLALELLGDVTNNGPKSGVSVQILQQFGELSEAEMKARVGAALAQNMEGHQVERSKRKGS
jgi:hypothetical protein